ncbi:putative transposase [Erwinia tracheiphila PSU-1]|nr:putative transposase [Erwinia tracheiphila PSU-1]
MQRPSGYAARVKAAIKRGHTTVPSLINEAPDWQHRLCPLLCKQFSHIIQPKSDTPQRKILPDRCKDAITGSCSSSELAAALKQVRELQRLPGKKTMEVEILKEAVEYGQSRTMDSACAPVE